MVLCHTQPFESLEARENDIIVTDKLIQGSKQLDIEIIDHLITNTEIFYSYVVESIFDFDFIKNSDQFLDKYMKEERYREEIKKERDIEIAARMLSN